MTFFLPACTVVTKAQDAVMPTNAPNIPFMTIKISTFPSVSYKEWNVANTQPANEDTIVVTTDLAAKIHFLHWRKKINFQGN